MKIDLAGQRFGRLIVFTETEKRKWGSVVWLCRCDCGCIVEVDRHNLVRGSIKSCGCLQQETRAAIGRNNRKHGDTPRNGKVARLYHAWRNMLNRCYNPNVKSFKTYGARGIGVCPEWRKHYLSFKMWALTHGYKDHRTIDRVNNDGNYCPENCRWLTRKQNIKKRWKEVPYAYH